MICHLLHSWMQDTILNLESVPIIFRSYKKVCLVQSLGFPAKMLHCEWHLTVAPYIRYS